MACLRRMTNGPQASLQPVRRNQIGFGRRQRREFVGGVAPVQDRLVGDNATVAETDEPGAVLGDVHLVRDER